MILASGPVDVVAFDLDGTLYFGDSAATGATQAVDRLRALGLGVLFFTNNSVRRREAICEKLERMGFRPHLEEVYTSGFATAHWVAQRGFKRVYVIGSDALREHLAEEGVSVVSEGGADALVVGYDPALDMATVGDVARALPPGLRIIAANVDAAYPVEGGERKPGCGAVVDAVQDALGCKAEFIVGKPGTYMLELLEADRGVRADRVMVVGDNVDSDIAMAKAAGCVPVLVDATGQTEVLGGLVVASVSEVPDLVESLASGSGETSAALAAVEPAGKAAEGRRKLVSIVIPLYNEEGNVDELARRLQAVFAENPDYDFEVVAVENGCTDSTYEKLLAVHNADPRFKILQLARNFRMDGGLTAGLHYASGDAAVLMTADLQDPPELITQFIEKWAEGYDSVAMVVTRREGTGALRRFNSQMFYWLINVMTGGSFPRNVSDFRLVDRKVYEVINSMGERNRFMRGMFFWAGFKSTGIEHPRPPRFAGESKADTLKVVELAMKGILSFSVFPLHIITWTGVTVSAISFLLLIYEVVRAVFFGVPFAGFGTIMGVMLLMFGFLFTMLGVVAEYIGLIYEEVKQRPNFVVRETIGL